MQRLSEAEALKQEGNQLYAQGDIEGAVVSTLLLSLAASSSIRTIKSRAGDLHVLSAYATGCRRNMERPCGRRPRRRRSSGRCTLPTWRRAT